jgi:carboxymethylenebutenolidase
MKKNFAALFLALPLCVAIVPTFADSRQVASDDKRIHVEYVEYPSPQGSGTIRGYLAYPWRQDNETVRAPAGLLGRPRPGVLVVHEDGGLTPDVENMVRQLAADKFVAFAPDARRTAFDRRKAQEDFVAAASYLKNRRECTGKVGVVGFSDRGSMAKLLAALVPDVTAVVSFDGQRPEDEDVMRIRKTMRFLR